MTQANLQLGNRQYEAAQEARFGLCVASALNMQTVALPGDVVERLRFARMQAMQRAQEKRSEERIASPLTVMRSGPSLSLANGGGPSRWYMAFNFLLLLLFISGVALIQVSQMHAEITAESEIDARLLSDPLPLASYTDEGFKEFLSDSPEQ